MAQKFLKSPFFIVGSPRSGTTLLQMLLDARPPLSIPPESHLFDHFSDLVDFYGDLNREQNLKKFVRDLLGDERIKRWGLKVTAAEFCGSLKERSFRGIISHLFGLYAAGQHKSRWGDKTPEHTLYLEQIRRIFPEARFIHLVRDGRDVAESLGRVFFGPPTIDQKAVLWKRYVNAFEDFYACHPDLCLTVHYEALALNPALVLRQVLEFLGEEAGEISAALPDTPLKQVYLNTDDGAHHSLKNPVTDQKVGIFRKGLSRRQIEIFESIAGTELKKYGYPLDSSGPLRARFHEKIIFWTVHQFRFLKKLNHPGYLKDRLQYHVRKRIMRMRKPL